VIVTRSTEIAADLLDRKPGVLEALVGLLRASPAVRELYSNDDQEQFTCEAADLDQGGRRWRQ
jgi:hypothetical protein